ncbi:MAG TPA: hypothetical protein PLK12_09865 [Prolixibacteraceae bacterium]|nr:hypothetical protein [Prolixibacteraceae bacterium]
MKQFFLLILMGFLLYTACEEAEPTDTEYPTFLDEIDSVALSAILDELTVSPFSACTSVDTFGFCFITNKAKGCNEEVRLDSNLSRAEIENLFFDALTNYSFLLSVDDPAKIRIESVRTLKGEEYDSFFSLFPDSVQPFWIITSNLQTYHDLPVRGTALKMMVSGDQVSAIEGRRFREIFLPAEDVYTEELAKESLIGREFSHKRSFIKPHAGTYWYDVQKMIVPLTRSGRIELRVCWILFPETWEIVVDTQTGEVLSAVDVSAL